MNWEREEGHRERLEHVPRGLKKIEGRSRGVQARKGFGQSTTTVGKEKVKNWPANVAQGWDFLERSGDSNEGRLKGVSKGK